MHSATMESLCISVIKEEEKEKKQKQNTTTQGHKGKWLIYASNVAMCYRKFYKLLLIHGVYIN